MDTARKRLITRESTKYLLWLLVSFVVVGAVEAHLPVEESTLSPLALPHFIVSAVLLFSWCKSHALENRIVSSGGYRLVVAFLPAVGLPAYFFRFFGFRNGGLKILKSLGFFVLLIAGYVAPFVMLKN